MMARRPRSASPEKNRGTDHVGIARLTRSPPTTKSYWSRRGALAPRGLCIRRLMDAPQRSQRRAPNARKAEAPKAPAGGPNDHEDAGSRISKGRERRRPKTAPDAVPPTRPLQVLPSPKIRSPSERVRPKSIGVPPPKTTAIGFATNAGRKNQTACGIASRAFGRRRNDARI